MNNIYHFKHFKSNFSQNLHCHRTSEKYSEITNTPVSNLTKLQMYIKNLGSKEFYTNEYQNASQVFVLPASKRKKFQEGMLCRTAFLRNSYQNTKFGSNWTTNKGETEDWPLPSLYFTKIDQTEYKG